MCCEARGCLVVHFILISVSTSVLLISVYGTAFLCGAPENPTCYGVIQNATLIYRNVTESNDHWKTEMYDTNMTYVFQLENEKDLKEIKGYDSAFCLRQYETLVNKLEVGSTYHVYTFYFDMDHEWSWYLYPGNKLTIYKGSFGIKLEDDDWYADRIKRCFKPIRNDDATLCYLAMAVSVGTIIVEIIVIAVMLPCDRSTTKRYCSEIFKG